MPTPTYTPLANLTLGSTASSVTFSSIPATYRDLILVGNYTGSAAGENVTMRFNGDSGSNYSRVAMFGNSSGSGSFSQSNQMFSAIYGSFRSHGIAQIMDYSATDKHKTTVMRTENTQQSEVVATASRWASTEVVNSIALIPVTGTFSSGSTFALYGIVA